MKKSLLSILLVCAMTMAGCGCTSADVTENADVTETEMAADAVVIMPVAEETEKNTEAVENEFAEVTEVAEEMELAEETECGENAAFTVTAMSATKYAKSSVNVRKGPSADYEKIGTLSTNQKVTVTGQADTGWYQIELNGEVAYVSNNYLVDEKVTVSETVNGNTGSEVTNNENVANGGTSTGASNAGGNGSGTSDSEEMWGDDWADAEEGGGAFDDLTDGEGAGVEIEISPLP